MNKRGRPRKHQSNADRQREYRQREKIKRQKKRYENTSGNQLRARLAQLIQLKEANEAEEAATRHFTNITQAEFDQWKANRKAGQTAWGEIVTEIYLIREELDL